MWTLLFLCSVEYEVESLHGSVAVATVGQAETIVNYNCNSVKMQASLCDRFGAANSKSLLCSIRKIVSRVDHRKMCSNCNRALEDCCGGLHLGSGVLEL